MKTKQIASTCTLLSILMVAAMILPMGCEEAEGPFIPGINNSSPEQPGDNLKTTFVVQPTGTSMTFFDGAVTLEFPSGAVYVPTEFTIVSCCMDNINSGGINTFKRGISLENDTGLQGKSGDAVLHDHVTIRLNYDLIEGSWNIKIPEDEEKLTIYSARPNFEVCQKINSLGDCCTDCSVKEVMGCIDQCGFYVVGEN